MGKGFPVSLTLICVIALSGLTTTAGYLLYRAGSDDSQPSPSRLAAPDSSGPVIDKVKNRSLKFATWANRGEIPWDDGGPTELRDALRSEPEDEIEPPVIETSSWYPNVAGLGQAYTKAAEQRLDPDGFVRKMTQDTQTLHAGRAAAVQRKPEEEGRLEASREQFSRPLPSRRLRTQAPSQRGMKAVGGSPEAYFQKLEDQSPNTQVLFEVGKKVHDRALKTGEPAYLSQAEAKRIIDGIGVHTGASDYPDD